ncbi:MAG: type II toxin-antitoxin system RelE/ParE family toxin [Bacteroidota bacterium]
MKKYFLSYEPQVEVDLKSAIVYYNERQKGLGKRFYTEYLSYLKHIKGNPLNFQKRYLNIHVAPLKVFPFLIFYIIDGNEIIVLTVLHSSQNPDNWPVEVPPIR